MVDDTERLVGRIVADRYRIESKASAGAFTVITVALDQQSHQPVTLKIVRPEVARRVGFGAEFARRCEQTATLTHPNIATVLDWGEVEVDGEPTWFWVSEYLAGGSLRDLLDRGRTLDPSQALVVGLEACRALDVAHQRGIVHTEVTPSKLVFGDERRLRVVDFGLAELLGAEAWEDPAHVPTHVARYASPEQALGMEVDASTDVYALSLVLIESVTGAVPFAGDSTTSTLAARVGRLMTVSADLGSLAAVLERAGRPDSEDRSTAAEFGRGLVNAAGTLPRPEPIPIIATGLFTAAVAREPGDPTGGLDRPVAVEAEPAAHPDAGAGSAHDPVTLAVADDAAVTGDDAEAGPAVDDAEEPVADAAVTVPVEEAAAEPLAPTEPLIVLTDIADDVEPVGPPPVEPTRQMVLGTTEQLPAAAVPAAVDAGSGAQPVIYDDEHPKRRSFKVVAVSILVLLALGALAFAGWLLVRTKSYEVPDLVGVQEEIALNEVSGNDWNVVRELERSDEYPEPGTVVRTVPAAGVELDEGETFVLFVSEGPELRTLPELDGMTLDEARATLEGLRLVASEAEPQYSEEVPAGSVISWTVEDDTALVAGDEVLPDTTIVLVVSQGPVPRPVPTLTGLTLVEARAALDELQLVLEEGRTVFSNDIEAGRVVVQAPAPESLAERGSAVRVRLSKGPDLVAFPDLTGRTYPQARRLLLDAGYTVESLLGTTEGTFVSASVDGDPVAAGDTYVRGTGVDLVFL